MPATSAAMAPAAAPASGSVLRCSTLAATTSNRRCPVSLRSRRTTWPTIHDLPLCRGAQTVTYPPPCSGFSPTTADRTVSISSVRGV